MDSPSVEASVIIGTYNGASKIIHLLDALLNQSVHNFEIIIVVDGSTDNTTSIVQTYSDKFKSMKIIEQSNEGRSRVRNNGAKMAESEILLFYDDDMVPEVDSVERHLQFHKKNHGLVCGNQLDKSGKDKTDIQNYKAYLSRRWTEIYKAEINQLTIDNLFYTAANASIKKTDFIKLNGFDERLTDGEDKDLAIRALQNNYPVFFDKKNIGIHHDPTTCRRYILRLREYKEAQKKLNQFYPERKAEDSKTALYKRLIYKIFASPRLVLLIDKQFFIFILPRKLRYLFYEIVIQSLANEFTEVPI